MTHTTRWLEELPLDAPERELLVAGKHARPPAGAVDAEWQALCIALTATAGVSGAATSGAVVNSLAAKTASAAVGTKAAGVTSWLVGAKWFVMGAALGCGVAGASAVAQRVSHREAGRTNAPPVVGAVQLPASKPRSSPGPVAAAPSSVELSNPTGEPALSEPAKAARSGARPADSARAEQVVAEGAGAASAEFPAPAAPTPAPLVEQARELAEVKRLIDAGSAGDALRRLDATRGAGAPFALSEERDALYVQALDKAKRRADARFGAREFLRRYPRSPYLGTMRRLLTDE